MKKNILFIAAAAMLAFAACEKEPVYVPGNPTGDNDNVHFSAMNASSVVLASDADQFTVLVSRDDSTAALSVPVSAWASNPEVFTFPATVEFAAGQGTAEYVVKTSADMEMFKDYAVRLNVSDEYTHAYDSLGVYPRYAATVVKEDYAPYAEGVFYDMFFTGEGWPITLEYSAILEMYRLSDVWAPLGTGSTTDLIFSWDGADKVVMNAGSYSTGVSYADYGNVTVVTTEDGIYYGTIPAGWVAEEAVEGFIFDFKWTVSAGSFGTGYPQFYVITEKL